MLGNLKLRQLHLLVVLDDQRKLQLAAERLNLSQSAASKMLTEIEAIAGVPLFERSARGVEPTPYGMILIRGGRSILADLDQATDELAGYKAGNLGTVAVGAVAAPSVDLIIDAIEYLGEKLNRIKISLHVDTSPPLINRLIARELDFAVARMPAGIDPRQFDYSEIIDEEEACLLVRAEHPLADRETISIGEMSDFRWIIQQRGSFMRQSIERLFRSHGIDPPHRVIDTDSFTASLGIAARTDVIVPMPRYIVDLVNPRLFRTLHFGEKLKLEGYGLVKLRDRVLSPAAAIVFEAMKRFKSSSVSAIVASEKIGTGS